MCQGWIWQGVNCGLNMTEGKYGTGLFGGVRQEYVVLSKWSVQDPIVKKRKEIKFVLSCTGGCIQKMFGTEGGERATTNGKWRGYLEDKMDVFAGMAADK